MNGSPEIDRDRPKRRLSILKPLGSKVSQSEPSTSPKLARRVSFASAHSIKPFAQDPEQNTIWDNSYQELVNHTDSTQGSHDQVSSKLCMTTQTTLEIDNVVCYDCAENGDMCVSHRNVSVKETIINSVTSSESVRKCPGSIIDYVKQSRSMSTISICDPLNEIDSQQEQLTDDGIVSMEIDDSVAQEKVSLFEEHVDFMGQDSTVSNAVQLADKENILFAKSNLNQVPGNKNSKWSYEADKENVYLLTSNVSAKSSEKSHVIFDQSSIVLRGGNFGGSQRHISLGSSKFVPASKATLPVVAEGLADSRRALDDVDMDFTSKIPPPSSAILATDFRNVGMEKSRVGLEETGMELTCQIPPTSRIVLPTATNLSLNKNKTILDNTGMEFTCQIPRTMLSNSTNVSLNQSKGVLENTGMEFTCQFPPGSRTLAVDAGNGLGKSRRALENIDVEFTCQIPPPTRTIVPTATHVGLNNTKTILDNTGMELTCQIPPSSRTVLPTTTNISLNKTKTILDNTGMEFTCQIPPSTRTIVPTVTNVGLNKNKTTLDDTGMEFTCQMLSSRAMLPVATNDTLNKTRSDNTGMEFTCQIPPSSRTMVPTTTNISLNKTKTVLDNTGMELTCQIPSASRSMLPVDVRNVGLEESRVDLENTRMEFTCQIPPSSRTVLPTTTNISLNKTKTILDNTGMEFTCQIPPSSRPMVPTATNFSLNKTKTTLDDTGMEFTCQMPSSRAMLPVATNDTLNKTRSDNTGMEFTCQIPPSSRTMVPTATNIGLNKTKTVLDNTGMELTCQIPSASRSMLPVDVGNVGLEESRVDLENTGMEFTCQIPKATLPTTSRNVSINKSKDAAPESTSKLFRLPFHNSALEKIPNVTKHADKELTGQLPFDNEINENFQWLSPLAESTVQLPVMLRGDFVTKQNASLETSKMVSNRQAPAEAEKELSTTLSVMNEGENVSLGNSNMASSHQLPIEVETGAPTASRTGKTNNVEFQVVDTAPGEELAQEESRIVGSETARETSNMDAKCRNSAMNSKILEPLKESFREIHSNIEQESREVNVLIGDVATSSLRFVTGDQKYKTSPLKSQEEKTINLPKSASPLLVEPSGGLYSQEVKPTNLSCQQSVLSSEKNPKLPKIEITTAVDHNTTPENVISRIPIAKSPSRITSRFPHDDKPVSSAIHGEFENIHLGTPKLKTPERIPKLSRLEISSAEDNNRRTFATTPENVTSTIPVAKSPSRITSRFPHDDKPVGSAIHGEFENTRLGTPKLRTPTNKTYNIVYSERVNKTQILKRKAQNLNANSQEPSFHINLSNVNDDNTCQLSSFVKPKLESFIKSIREDREDDTGVQLNQDFSQVSLPNVTDTSYTSVFDPPRDLPVPNNASFSTLQLNNRFLHANDTYFMNKREPRDNDNATSPHTSSDSLDLSHLLERTKLDCLVDSEELSFNQPDVGARNPLTRQALANVRLEEFVLLVTTFNVKKNLQDVQRQSDDVEDYLLNFQLAPKFLPDLTTDVKEETNEESCESYEETKSQEVQMEFADISSIEKLPTVEEKIRQSQNSSPNFWKLERTEDSTYTFSTLAGTIIFDVQLIRASEIVTNISTKVSIHRDCRPLNAYINKLFVERLRPNNIRAAIGSNFDIMSLLDYVELTYRKLLEFYMDMNGGLIRYNASIDKDFVAKFVVANDALFEVLVDLKKLETLTADYIKVEPKIGEVIRNDVEMVAMNCPKDSDFLRSCIKSLVK